MSVRGRLTIVGARCLTLVGARESDDCRCEGASPCEGASQSVHQEARLVALVTARPDATLAELQEAVPTTAALSTI